MQVTKMSLDSFLTGILRSGQSEINIICSFFAVKDCTF